MPDKSPGLLFSASPYLYLGVSIALRSINLILFKQASITLDSFTFLDIITNVFFLISFMLFFLRSFTWQMTLSLLPLYFAYPFISIAYLVMLAAGYFIFGEPVQWFHLLGAAFIIGGLYLMVDPNKMRADE